MGAAMAVAAAMTIAAPSEERWDFGDSATAAELSEAAVPTSAAAAAAAAAAVDDDDDDNGFLRWLDGDREKDLRNDAKGERECGFGDTGAVEAADEASDMLAAAPPACSSIDADRCFSMAEGEEGVGEGSRACSFSCEDEAVCNWSFCFGDD